MKIYAAILTMGEISYVLSQKLNEIILDVLKNNKHKLMLIYSGIMNVADNRNKIAKDFLQTDCDFLLMIDADNPPLRNPIDLVELDKDIITCPTPIFTEGKISFNVFDKTETGYNAKIFKENNLFECDRVGSGCILIKRSVIEALPNPFKEVNDDDGIKIESEDIAFCNRAKQKGFKVWGHWDYLCHHFKTVDLLEILKILKL